MLILHRFALSLEPANAHVQKKLEWATETRKKGLPTVPSVLKEVMLFLLRCKVVQRLRITSK